MRGFLNGLCVLLVVFDRSGVVIVDGVVVLRRFLRASLSCFGTAPISWSVSSCMSDRVRFLDRLMDRDLFGDLDLDAFLPMRDEPVGREVERDRDGDGCIAMFIKALIQLCLSDVDVIPCKWCFKQSFLKSGKSKAK